MAGRGGVLSMRRVTATREVVNSARRKCSDCISDMVLFSFDVLFLMIVLMMIVVLMFWMIVLMMIVLMIVCFDDRFDDLAEPRQQKCEVESP